MYDPNDRHKRMKIGSTENKIEEPVTTLNC